VCRSARWISRSTCAMNWRRFDAPVIGSVAAMYSSFWFVRRSSCSALSVRAIDSDSRLIRSSWL
jgi:hypothetical protein